MTDKQAEQSHEAGSFLTGLGVGLIGGAVGYFLFATDKGEKVKKQLVKEWQNHRKMPEDVSDGVDSLRKLAGDIFSEILETAKQEQQSAEEELRKTKSKKKKKMFKGVK